MRLPPTATRCREYGAPGACRTTALTAKRRHVSSSRRHCSVAKGIARRTAGCRRKGIAAPTRATPACGARRRLPFARRRVLLVAEQQRAGDGGPLLAVVQTTRGAAVSDRFQAWPSSSAAVVQSTCSLSSSAGTSPSLPLRRAVRTLCGGEARCVRGRKGAARRARPSRFGVWWARGARRLAGGSVRARSESWRSTTSRRRR